jgi:signal transduction histidine kinase
MNEATTDSRQDPISQAVPRPWSTGNVDGVAIPGGHDHRVHFYENDAFLIDSVTDYIGDGITSGGVGIVIATAPHRDGITDRLSARGIDVLTASSQGRYVSLDAAETLSRLMNGAEPEFGRLTQVIDEIVPEPSNAWGQFRVFGEMVALLAIEGNNTAALDLERHWNDILSDRAFSLLCAYPIGQLRGETSSGFVNEISANHSCVIPGESFVRLSTEEERVRQIVVLQQQARQLEHEITVRKRLEEQLQATIASERAACQEAEGALRLRDAFLATAAHELRTPIAGLSGRVQLLLRQAKRRMLEPGAMVPAFEGIAIQANKLSRLITELLDVSRLELGKMDLELYPTELGGLIQETLAFAPSVTEHHEVTFVASDPILADVDALRLGQAVENVIDNALKFSPKGSTIQVVLSRASDGYAEISVLDNGPGVPLEQREQIFERFYQASEDGSGSGMGLGLYISREVVALHGGEILVDSLPEGGAHFTIRIPLTNSQRRPTSVGEECVSP